MRSENDMYDLILKIARKDKRIRAVILNGSRANPNAPGDIFQDFDIVYMVTEVSSFKEDPNWIDLFGKLMIMQLPDDMQDPPPSNDGSYGYLMQFADGNRIDLTLYPVACLSDYEQDSLSVLLLDKDGIIEPFPPSNDRDYLPSQPTAKAFADSCNEFWWVCTYVAKGLWREEILYANYMLNQIVREQLMKMLVWYIGIKTGFACNSGKFGKYFKKYLEPDLWDLLLRTYSDADYDHTWQAMDAMCQLFRITSHFIASSYNFDYPRDEDDKVSAHLHHVRYLPKDAVEMY